jgi:exopolysaccharide biosynthesis protein
MASAVACNQWSAVAPGLSYREIDSGGVAAHVARIDILHPELRVIASSEQDRGLTVGEYARRYKPLIAVNADYFDKERNPIGLAIGPCGRWTETEDTKREGVLAIGEGRVEIFPPSEVNEPPAPWIRSAVSGWPMVVRDCSALSADELPGSDHFTRAPHPRTAAGISKDGRFLYLVVADGRQQGIPGLTLEELGKLMKRIGACTAINLDGGGSSAFALRGEIVNRPSDGVERRVANHLAAVPAGYVPSCDPPAPSTP